MKREKKECVSVCAIVCVCQTCLTFAYSISRHNRAEAEAAHVEPAHFAAAWAQQEHTEGTHWRKDHACNCWSSGTTKGTISLIKKSIVEKHFISKRKHHGDFTAFLNFYIFKFKNDLKWVKLASVIKLYLHSSPHLSCPFQGCQKLIPVCIMKLGIWQHCFIMHYYTVLLLIHIFKCSLLLCNGVH